MPARNRYPPVKIYWVTGTQWQPTEFPGNMTQCGLRSCQVHSTVAGMVPPTLPDTSTIEDIWTKPSICVQLQTINCGDLEIGENYKWGWGEADKLSVLTPDILLRSTNTRFSPASGTIPEADIQLFAIQWNKDWGGRVDSTAQNNRKFAIFM
jgi:hypothetical protein